MCVAALFLAPVSQAAYEQLPGTEGIFGGSTSPVAEGKFSEEVQLGGSSGLAVNRTGAGGVKEGTIYSVTEAPSVGRNPRVVMFEPATAGGGLEFTAGWQVAEVEGPYERCGPLLGTKEVGGQKVAEHPCATRPESSPGSLGIAVDQSTGDVYVYASFPAESEKSFRPGTDQVVVYTATGSEVITRFGEQALPGEKVLESPGKVHRAFAANVLAVNGAGEAFVYDEARLSGANYHRLMVFRPHEGDRSHYEYVGEIDGGESQEREPHSPSIDDAGHIYVAGTYGAGDHIEELAPETPGPYPHLAATPVCEYRPPQAVLKAMTVDPVTEELFFYTSTNPARIRRLGVCDEATHKFAGSTAPEQIGLLPRPEEYLAALAVDPGRTSSPARPTGQLYAATAGVNEKEFVEGGHSALGYIFGHPAEFAGEVESESVGNVDPTSALLRASINPLGFATKYAFQYLTATEYEAHGFEGAPQVPIGGGQIQGSGGIQTVTAVISSLTPATLYQYRVVIESPCKGPSSPECASEGKAEQFRTFPASTALLPDDRAWELVSPSQKNGGQVIPADSSVGSCVFRGCKPGEADGHYPMLSSPDGEGLIYEGLNFGDGGAANENAYLARRSADSWKNVNLTPGVLAKGGQTGGYRGATPSLQRTVLIQKKGKPAFASDAPAAFENLYTQSTSSPSVLTALITEVPPNRSIETFEVSYADASADGERIFFAANDKLTPEAEVVGASKFDLYEWFDGRLTSVNVLPDGEASPGEFARASANTVSEDGARAFWSNEAGQVFVRVEGSKTLELPDASGKFLSAAADGTRVLLADGRFFVLSEGGQSGEAYVEAADLAEGKAGFEGVLGQSSDLTRIYFVDNAEIGEIGQENAAGEVAQTGAQNLYSWQLGGTVRFVARLSPEDYVAANEDIGGHGAADWAKIPANRTAEASPGGRYLAFVSHQALTGRDNVGPCKETFSESGIFEQAPCPEAFIYDAQAETLVCASCNPSLAAPLGPTTLRRIRGGSFAPQPRYLTDSGRLYFDTQDSLSPRDTNESIEDVYEWEPQDVGDCGAAFAEGGCVALISAGREGVDSNLLAVDESGKNVFFTTRDRLVGADTDQLIDIYDAREDGGFAEEQSGAQCQGEACQPSSGTNAPEAKPASPGFQGTGNYRSPKCAKGKIQNHGKCVTKKKHHHKKKKKKKGGKSANVKQGGRS
jgi:hypothetical protein